MKQTFTQKIPSDLPGGFFIYTADQEETILFADQNVIRLFGCVSYEEFLEYTSGSFRNMVHPEDLPKVKNEIQAQTRFGERRHDYVRYRIITRQGTVRYIEDFGHLLHGEDCRSYFYVFIVDVDAQEYLNRSRNSFAEAHVLSLNSDTDPLTGLFNMAFFYQHVQNILSASFSCRQDHAIIQFDIPNFKLFNERYSFRKGDELLCSIARTIHQCFPQSVCARFSDDHFAVFTSGSRKSITEKTEEVTRLVRMHEEPSMRVRLKAGIYFLDDYCTEVGLACDHARLACSSIKDRHDVQYCIYDEMLRERLRRQQYVLDHIDEAIENRYLKVYYQPVVRTETGKICGYEALSRWMDPRYGMLSPSDFIETLEHFHLIQKLDAYVIEQAARDYRKLKESGEAVVPVSVNLSRLDFELCDVLEMVDSILSRYGMPRSMMDLEITESALNSNERLIKDKCECLRKSGYHIWLDDFGSGYSSLNTLADYDFDVLKLDLVFLRSYDRNPKTAALMDYIIHGARGMNLEPLCEGVETPEHYEFLKKIGCAKAQGYYFGKPMPMEESRACSREKGLEWEQTEQ